MTTLKRPLPHEDRHCDHCDHMTFKWRASGRWAFCVIKDDWFPDRIEPGAYVCDRLTFGGTIINE